MKRGCLLNSIADFTQISYGIYSILAIHPNKSP